MRRFLVIMLFAVQATAATTGPAQAESDVPSPTGTIPAPLAQVAAVPDDLRLNPATVPGGEEALKCLALNDYWEARGESLPGRVAVAMVVLNRVHDDRYPDDVCGVVTENRGTMPYACQFSWHCDGRDDTPHETTAWERSLLLAAAVLHAQGSMDDPSRGALWYHARSVTPDWSSLLEPSKTIGNHVFYRDPADPGVPGPPQLAAAEP